ncbi:helix-turn-helix transcriptional regulator [Peribacillus simplex]|uniref:helix-turn-helix transcriptional regulator n=1 Tax=Peribacillus simplex TaxID=1478 RepID=UPI003D29F1D1
MNNNIKELRELKGYSQEDLAKKLGVSRQTIISIEKNRFNPSLPLAMQISKLFDTYVENIFVLDEKN